jgi:hypothetical protein
MKSFLLVVTILSCLTCSWLLAADDKAPTAANDKASPAAQNPAESKSVDAKAEKTESKLNGRWEGKITRQNGEEMKLVYTFKVDGEKLTGKSESPRGEREISEGKVKGDEFSFNVELDNGNKIEYQGKVSDNKINLKSKAPWGEREITLSRVVDINGRWLCKFETPDGNEMELTFTFKVDGEELTGKVESEMGELDITNGKVKGDEFSFDVEMGGNTIGHECKISGDEIKMKVIGFPEEREFLLKRLPAK